ncbi:M36 family metallopeptidase [Myxococcus stipitatus]|uniref:M36 family metallopeptidase n=1 Tax=Myxococcus stipitatus TaxID=83455 RepID=UPI002278D136|nr:M36 family metallopeptidase [Myxococcus stipitatus]
MSRLPSLLAVAMVVAAPPLLARERLPTVDAFTSAPASSTLVRLDASAAPGLVIAHQEERLGVPTFAWVRSREVATASLAASSRTPEQTARGLVEKYAPVLRLKRTDAEHVPVKGVHPVPSGGRIVEFAQRVGGVEVFRQSLKVFLDGSGVPVTMSGHLSPVATEASFEKGRPFALEPREAIARAYADLEGHTLPAESLRDTGDGRGAYRHFELTPGPRTVRLTRPARAKPVYFALPDTLVPGYYVEVGTESREEGGSGLYAYVISAEDGRLLLRHALRKDAEPGAFTYRVWAEADGTFLPWDGPQGEQGNPHPTGLPDGYQAPLVAPNQVTLRNAPFSRNDPWLSPDATLTEGNNARAFADLAAPDGYGEGDVLGTLTAPGVFDHVHDPRAAPGITDEQVRAGLTHVFYVNNFLHDWFYDAGFDEASGNGQRDNYGRGGLGGDALDLRTQHHQMRNNAFVEVTADGMPSVVRYFIFDSGAERSLYIGTASETQGPFGFAPADFGPQQYDFTASAVWAEDGEGASSHDACAPLTNADMVRGNLAVVERGGGCDVLVKAGHVQEAGAVAMLLLPVSQGVLRVPGFGGRSSLITIPVAAGNSEVANRVRAALAQGPATVRLLRAGPARDSAFDTTLVAHEWAHFMTNRLIGDGSGLLNNQGFSLGEGWSDFAALLLTVREQDARLPGNENFGGTYAIGGYLQAGGANQGHYWGLRRYPYSTNQRKNPLLFRHIEDRALLPDTIPINPELADEDRWESHNSGEVWASLLWDCYVALLRDTGRLTFAQAQARMKEYLVTSLKLTPINPTFTEARDALLAAAAARDALDLALFSRAFARRGMGTRAVAPARNSFRHEGVFESYDTGKDLAFVRAELLRVDPDCDDDASLDQGEEAVVRVTLRNSGTGRLEQSSVTVASTPEGLRFPKGNRWQVPPSEPFQEVSVDVPVSVDGMAPRSFYLVIAFRDEQQSLPGVQTALFPMWVSRDEAPVSSVEETVEAVRHPWRMEEEPAGFAPGWARVARERDLGHHFNVPPTANPGLRSLVSPPLQVSTSRPFRFTFRHRHFLEYEEFYDPDLFLDGAVLELSTDDGRTWTDIGAAATPTYNVVVSDAWGDENPLVNRPAWGAKNAAYPELETVTVDLGGAYVGKTVRIRFAVGTNVWDQNWADMPVWDVDDLRFEGLDNTPFTAVVEDAGHCENHAPVVGAVPGVEVPEGVKVTLAAPGRDADGDALTYEWTVVEGPAVTLEGAEGAVVSFTAPEVKGESTLVLSVVASDGRLRSAPQSVRVRIVDASSESCGGCASGGVAPTLGALLFAVWLSRARRRHG